MPSPHQTARLLANLYRDNDLEVITSAFFNLAMATGAFCGFTGSWSVYSLPVPKPKP
jgi:hypothetical protein